MKTNILLASFIAFVVISPTTGFASPSMGNTGKPVSQLQNTTSLIPSHQTNELTEQENIEVIGKIPTAVLYKRVLAARLDFYDLFNQINEERKYQMFCTREAEPGSNIRKLKCEPEYYRNTRRRLALSFVGGGNPNFLFDLPAFVQERWVQAAAQEEMDEAYVYLHKLVQENEQLWQAYQNVVATTRDYEARKAPK